MVEFFKNLPWWILYPGKAMVAAVGGYVSQNPQIFPHWAVLLGAALSLWIVLAFIWHAINAWREHNKKSRLKLEPSHVIIMGLAIALGGVVWQMRSVAPSDQANNPTRADLFDWNLNEVFNWHIPGGGQLFVDAFKINGVRRGPGLVVLESAEMVSLVTGEHLPLQILIPKGGGAPADQVEPIAPEAKIGLVASLRKSGGEGMAESDFIRRWGKFEFRLGYRIDGSKASYSHLFDWDWVQRKIADANPNAPFPTPVVTRKADPHDIPKKLALLDPFIDELGDEFEAMIQRAWQLQSNWMNRVTPSA